MCDDKNLTNESAIMAENINLPDPQVNINWNESVYDKAPLNPVPVNNCETEDCIYDTVTGAPVPVSQAVTVQNSEVNIDTIQNETSLESVKKSEESSNKIDKMKSSSKQVKKADSLKDLSRKVSNGGKGVQRSTSFTKKSLMKISGKKDKISSEEGGNDHQSYEMIDKANGTLYLKKKKFFSTWRKYFFVLDGSQLTYFTNVEHYHKFTLSGCQGSIDLTLLESVVKKNSTSCFKTYYSLLLGRRSLTPLYLGAENEADQSRWLELFQRALNARKAASKRIRRSTEVADPSSPDVVSSTFTNEILSESPTSADKKGSNLFRKSSIFNKSSVKKDKRESKESKYEIVENITEPGKNYQKLPSDHEDELIVKPKPLPKPTLGIPTTAILSVKLKKTSVSSEKENLLPENPDKNITNFGVQLKNVKKMKTQEEYITDDIQNEIEHDFRSILKSRKNTQNCVTKVNHNANQLKTDTLDKDKKKRSPSPKLPISKSLKSVLDKSTDNSNLILENQIIEIKDSEVLSDPQIHHLDTMYNNYDTESNVSELCAVNHAVAEKIRYSDPPGELEVFDEDPPLSRSLSLPLQENTTIVTDISKNDLNITDTRNEKCITVVKSVSQLQNNILVPTHQYNNYDICSEQVRENSVDLNNDEVFCSYNNSDNSSEVRHHQIGVNFENKNELTLIHNNESSISLSPKSLTKRLNIECNASRSLNDLHLAETNSKFIKIDDIETNSNPVDELKVDVPEDIDWNTNNGADHMNYNTNSSSNEIKDPKEFEIAEQFAPDVQASIDMISNQEIPDTYNLNISEINKQESPKIVNHEIKIIVNQEIPEISEVLQEELNCSNDPESFDEDHIPISISYGPNLSFDRSPSVESGEPLPRTSFMGGRRSWSSISNVGSKVDSNSQSSTSKDSMEVSLRCDEINNADTDLLCPFPNKVAKRNSSGYAETLAKELTSIKRQRMRASSNPIINNRESLISPEFVVVEEIDELIAYLPE